MNFNFGGNASKTSVFSLPSGTAAAPLLGNPVTSATAAAGTAPTVAAGPFSLGGGDPGAGAAAKSTQPQLSVPTNFSFGAAPKLSLTTSATTSISTTTATSAPTFGLGGGLSFSRPTTTTVAAAAATTTTAVAAATTAATTTAAAIVSATTGTTTSAPTLTSASSLAPAVTTQTTLGTATTVTTSSAATAPALNFTQLEEAINKWTLELEEQEKQFMNQASQVNTWDRMLIANGEKIINLNHAVEHVKLEQQQLDHELDFILAQQRELEDLLTPLEKELETNTVTDPEREHTYKLAENMDVQLKQMSEDLKEIVEHINEVNRSQDNTDPIVQIGRILNAHMNSLQWIDQNTTLIGTHLDQVAKLHEVHRRENERSFRLTYD